MERAFLYVDLLKDVRSKIQQAISQIRVTRDPEDLITNLCRDHIKPLVDYYEPIVSPLASHYGDTIFRARICTARTPFTDIRKLLNPPVPSGRAYSSSSKPILYASSSVQTCKAELDLKIGDLVNVVGLNYSSIADAPFWFIGQLAGFNKSKEPSHYVGNTLGLERTGYYSHEAQQSFIFHDALINEIFSKFSTSADGYIFNRYLIEAVNAKRSGAEPLAGVVYLSTKDAPGVNFAIFGDAISRLKVGQLNFVEVTDIDDYGTVGYKLRMNGSLNGTEIEWRSVA